MITIKSSVARQVMEMNSWINHQSIWTTILQNIIACHLSAHKRWLLSIINAGENTLPLSGHVKQIHSKYTKSTVVLVFNTCYEKSAHTYGMVLCAARLYAIIMVSHLACVKTMMWKQRKQSGVVD